MQEKSDRYVFPRILLFAFIVLFISCGNNAQGKNINSWKVGVAKAVITPEQPLWMAGFAIRNKPADGKLHDLWAKAMFIEDSKGYRALLVSTDILGFPKFISDLIRDSLEIKLGLSREQILLNSSHTHSGPVLLDALKHIYPIDSIQQEKINRYSTWLANRIITLAVEAAGIVKPAKVYSGNGVVRFQVNRRNNSEANLLKQPELKGPNDYAVPVLKIADQEGSLKAVIFGYACHPTVLNGYQWSGDYPGFAQLEIEKMYPGAIALFVQGAGGDLNAFPRRTIPLAVQYGKELAAAVERVLNEDMKELKPHMFCAYKEIQLPLNQVQPNTEIAEIQKSAIGYHNRWATDMLFRMASGEKFISHYPYPIQAWRLDNQLIFGLGGELLVNYSFTLKQLFGEDIFVLGYTNDLMGYIPSERVLFEGGYEGHTSSYVYNLPSKWKEGIEQTVINEMISLAKEVNIE